LRKSFWISFVLVGLVGSLMAGLEARRAHYFMGPKLRSPDKRSFDYQLAFLTQRAEWFAQDTLFKVRPGRPPSPDIAIIGIDEPSVAAYGQWPFPRKLHAALIRRLKENPPKALLFDILFIEHSPDPAGDAALVRATRDNPWVIHSFFIDYESPPPVKAPFPKLLAASSDTGFVNAFPDEDGVLRHAIPRMTFDTLTINLLSVIGTARFLGMSPEGIVKRVPLDARGQVWVNFTGLPFTAYSYVDFLTGKLDPAVLRGKIVLVGSKTVGAFDHYPTPTSTNMPGVELHANLIDNLLNGNALRWAGLKATLWAVFGMVLFCGLFVANRSAGVGAACVLGAAGIYAVAAYQLFAFRNEVLDLAGPLATLLFGYLAVVIHRFFTEEREKRWVKAAFGQYVSPKVLEILMQDPAKLKLVGERRDMTVFFSDVAGFTSISERMNPDELVVLLNRYLSAMTEVIFEYDGYLNKYMGDGIMAFWNAPVKQVDHAERACRCALKSMRRLAEFNEELKAQGIVPLGARIGINSGTMVVGNMGSRQKSDYTVMGDNVNLGSRLEGANKAFGSAIMISEFTYEIVQDKFEVRFLDRIRVPGKARPVKVYELLAEKGGLDAVWQKVVPLYHEAIQLFADKEFPRAREKFLEVCAILPQDKASMLYVHRAEAFAAEPPADNWDSVFEVKSK
jgi:adenylate cyclase